MAPKLPNEFYRHDWVKLWRQGFSCQELGKKFGVTASSISKYIRSRGIDPARIRNNRRWRWIPKHDLISLYEVGKSLAELSQLEGVGYKRIKAWLRRQGVHIR